MGAKVSVVSWRRRQLTERTPLVLLALRTRLADMLLSDNYSERWRYTGLFSRWNRFKGTFPGLGIATVAFAAYCGYEYMFLKDEHHGEGHGEEHH